MAKTNPISLTHTFCLGARSCPVRVVKNFEPSASPTFVCVFKHRLYVNGCSLTSERRWVVVGSPQLTLAFLWTGS